EAHADEIEAVLVVGGDGEARVIVRPLEQVMILVHESPTAPAVIGAVKAGVFRLDQRVHAIRIATRDGDRCFAHRFARQSVDETPPSRPSILRLVDATRAPAALDAP